MGRLDCKEPSHLALACLAREADYFETITDEEADAAVVTLAGHGIATTPSGVAGIAGLVYASQLSVGTPIAGQTYELDAIAAVVVGGTSLFGGKGRLTHAAIGALVIAVIANGLGLLRMPAGLNLIVTGAVLILAATVDALSRLRSGGTVRT